MMVINKVFKKIATVIDKILLTISISVLILLISIVSIQVFVRYILKGSLPWVQEVSSGLLIWLTFIGAAYLVRGNLHLRVDMFINKFPTNIKKIVNQILNLLNLIFVIVIGIFSFELFNTQISTPLGVLGIPRAFYFALPILIFSIMTPFYILEEMFKKSK